MSLTESPQDCEMWSLFGSGKYQEKEKIIMRKQFSKFDQHDKGDKKESTIFLIINKK